MLLSVIIAVMNQLEETRDCWDANLANAEGDYELIVIDNSSTDGTPDFIHNEVAPRVPRFEYIRNEGNQGVWGSLRQGYEAATGELLAFIHNDVALFEKGWNLRFASYFERIPRLGVAGLHGSRWCLAEHPWRADSFSNMLLAEAYGQRLRREFMPVAVLDGFCIVCCREILDQAGGIDARYVCHHMYDFELSLLSLSQGYVNIVVDISCRHIGWITSESTHYRKWASEVMGTPAGDETAMNLNRARFLEKWGHFLPVFVDEKFGIRGGGI